MDLSTVEGFAAAVLGDHDEELAAFAESVAGIQIRELCEEMLAFYQKIHTPGSSIGGAEIEQHANASMSKISKVTEDVVDAFTAAHPEMGPNATTAMRTRVRYEAYAVVERLVVETKLKAMVSGGKSNLVVLQ